jgi:hypothetical protein
MPALVDDAMLDTYAVIGTYDGSREAEARYSRLATHLRSRCRSPCRTPRRCAQSSPS